jgi:hypothetical protein
VDGDLLALDGVGAGADFQDLLLESHLRVLRVSSPELGDCAALVLWFLTGGCATYISGFFFYKQRVHTFIPQEFFPFILSRIIS